MHLFFNWCTKEKRQNRGSSRTVDKTQDGEKRVKRDTHIQVKWKLEQQDDKSN